MGLFQRIGAECIYFLENAGRMGIFLYTCLLCAVTPPYKVKAIIRQIYFIGARSVFVIIVTGLFTGMVLGLQGYYTLSNFGSEGLLGSGVAVSLLRELGPVLTALTVIGRAGSAMCAEIGIMRNSEQIDALECMAIDPYRFVMAPKYIATIISMPILTFIFDVVGIIGGYIVGVSLLGLTSGAYFQGMYSGAVWADIEMGLIKAFLFGLVVVWVCTSKGFHIHMERSGGFGAEGVSRATTSAVVLASVMVLVWDYIISAIML